MHKSISLPCGASEEIIRLSVHEFRSEFAHFLLHFPHFCIEPLPNTAEFCVDNAEIAQFDGDVSSDSFGHFYSTKLYTQSQN